MHVTIPNENKLLIYSYTDSNLSNPWVRTCCSLWYWASLGSLCQRVMTRSTAPRGFFLRADQPKIRCQRWKWASNPVQIIIDTLSRIRQSAWPLLFWLYLFTRPTLLPNFFSKKCSRVLFFELVNHLIFFSLIHASKKLFCVEHFLFKDWVLKLLKKSFIPYIIHKTY